MEDLKNGTAISTPPALPAAHPDVIRQAQFLIDQLQQGRIIGFAAVGITADGNAAHVQALPQNASIIQLAMGGLGVIISDMAEAIKTMRHPQGVSRILKPPSMMRAGNG
jgi:hypothetical protein